MLNMLMAGKLSRIFAMVHRINIIKLSTLDNTSLLEPYLTKKKLNLNCSFFKQGFWKRADGIAESSQKDPHAHCFSAGPEMKREM